MKTYTIIGGVNGVGKSSFTGVLRESRTDLGFVIDVDKITAELHTTPLLGGKEALRRVSGCLQNGYSFTQETTLAGHRTEATARTAKENGYFVRLFYIGLDSLDESLERIQNRVRHGGHNIPPEDVTRRYSGRFEAVRRILPYCNEAEFYDNGNGFVKVGEYRNGVLLRVGEYAPQWMRQLQAHLRSP